MKFLRSLKSKSQLSTMKFQTGFNPLRTLAMFATLEKTSNNYSSVTIAISTFVILIAAVSKASLRMIGFAETVKSKENRMKGADISKKNEENGKRQQRGVNNAEKWKRLTPHQMIKKMMKMKMRRNLKLTSQHF